MLIGRLSFGPNGVFWSYYTDALLDVERLTQASCRYIHLISEEVICEANHKHSVRNVISLFGIVTVVGSTVFLSSMVQ